MPVGNYSLSALGGEKQQTTDVNNIRISGEVYDINSNIKTTSFYDWNAKLDYYTGNITSTSIIRHNDSLSNANRNLFSKYVEDPMTLPTHTEYVNIKDFGNSFTVLLNSNSTVENNFFKKSDDVKYSPKILELKNINYICHISVNFDVKTEIGFMTRSFLINDSDNVDLFQTDNSSNYVIPNHAIFLNKTNHIYNTFTNFDSINDTSLYKYDFTQDNKLSKGWNRLDIFILNDTALDTTNKIHAFSLGFSFQLFKYTDNLGVLQQRVDKNTISYSPNLSQIYPLDGTLNLINNNFNIVSAYYPNTNKLFNITEQTVSILNANDINVTNEISENSEYLKDKYVLSGGNSKFLDIYIAEIPDENSDNTCNLYLHLKFDTVNNDIKELLSYPQYVMNIENSSVINAYKIEYGKTSVELISDYFKEIRDAFHIIGNSSLKLNQDKNSGYKYFLNVQLISNEADNISTYSFTDMHRFTLMFWFRYIKSDVTKQYLIQMYNKTDPKRSIFELFLKKDNDDRMRMHLFISSVYYNGNGGIDHFEHAKIVENINFENNKWYHVSFGQSDDESRLLINGIIYDVTEDGNIKHKFRTLAPSETYINIGANALTGDITGAIHQNLRSEKQYYTDFFVGNFDDLRYYNIYQPESFIAENIIGKVLYLTTNGLTAFGNTGISLSQFEQKIGIGTNEPVSNIHIKGDTYIDGLITVSSNIPELNIDNLNVESAVISNVEVLNLLKLNNIDAINQSINFFSNINSIERDYEYNIEIYGTTRFFNTVSFDSQLISKESESNNIPFPETDAPVANFGDSFQLNVKQNYYKDKHEYHLTVPHENAGIDINIGQGSFTSKNASIETINVDTLKVNVAQVIPTLKIESNIENDRTIDIANFTSEKIDIYQSCSFINTAKFEEKIWSSNTNTFTGINNFTQSIKAKTIDIIDHIKLNSAKIYSTVSPFELTDKKLTIASATIENLTYNKLIAQDIAQTVSVNIAGNASPLNILYSQEQISFNDYVEADYMLNFTINKQANSQVDINDDTKGYYIHFNDSSSELQAKKITSDDSNFVSEDYFIVDTNEYDNSKVSYLLNNENAFSEDLNFDGKMWEAFLVIKYKQNFTISENNTPTQIFRYKDFVLSIQDTQLNKAKILFNDSKYVPIVTNNWYVYHIGQKKSSGNYNEIHINVNGMNIGSYSIPFESTDGKYYFSNIDENIGSVLIDNIIFKKSTYKELLEKNYFINYLPVLETIEGFGFIKELQIYSNASNIDTGKSKIEPVFEINHGYIKTKNSLYVNIISDELYINYGNLIINEPAIQYDYFSEHYPAAIFTKPLYSSNIYENVSTPLLALNMRQQSDLYGEYSQFATFELSKWSNTDLNLSYGDYSQTQLDFKLAHENFTDSSNILTLRSGGYVGINNNAPTSNLDISGNTRISGDLDVLKNVNITSNLKVHNKTYIYNELSVSSNTTLSNNLNINGNGIYSTSDSFDLLTSHVYTLNFGLHARNINIGSNIGNTIVENDLYVNGNSYFTSMNVYNISLESNQLNSVSDTFNLLNDCDNINFGDSASNVSIGSTNGNTYINNDLVAQGYSHFEKDMTLSNNYIFVKGTLTIGKYNGDDVIELHLGDEEGLLYVDTKSLDANNPDEDFELFNSVKLPNINFAGGAVNLNIGASNINVDSELHISKNTKISDSDFNSSNIIFREANKNWGIYVAASGQDNSLSGGNATIGYNHINDEALRLRVKESDQSGFIIENNSEVELFSVNASTGETYIKGETTINGDVNILRDLTVNGITSNIGDVNIIGNLQVNNNVNISSDLNVQGSLIVDGITTTINTATEITDQLIITNEGTGTALIINQLGNNAIIDLQVDSTTVFYIENGGNVGIGITTPTAKLHVDGDVNISTDLTVNGITNNVGNVNIIGKLEVTNDVNISTHLTVDGDISVGKGDQQADYTLLNFNFYRPWEFNTKDFGLALQLKATVADKSFYIDNNFDDTCVKFHANGTDGNNQSWADIFHLGINKQPNTAYKLDVNGSARIDDKVSIGSDFQKSSYSLGVNGTVCIGKLSENGDNNDDIDTALRISGINEGTPGKVQLCLLDNNDYADISVNSLIGEVNFGINEAYDDDTANGPPYSLVKTFGSIKMLVAYVDTNILKKGHRVQGDLTFSTSDSLGNSATYQTDTNIDIERMRIKYNGDVGIGTTQPDAKLDVSGDVKISGTNNESFFNHGNNEDVYIRAGTNITNSKVVIADNSTNTYVGIGITTPTEKLHVNGTILANSDIISNFGSGKTIELSTPLGNPGFIISKDSANNYSRFDMYNYPNATLGNRYFSLGFNGDTPLTIQKGGNVGIGKVNPTSKLDVVGDVNISEDLTVNGGLTVNGTSTTINTNTEITGNLIITNDGVGLAVDINHIGTNDIINIKDEDTSVFYIKNGGNVGIGKANPTSKLDVVGDVNISTNLTVNGNVNISTDLTVYGNFNIYTDLQVNGDVSISTDLTVNGTTNISDNLNVNQNVGIGKTADSSYRLDVNGDVRTNDLTATSGTFSSRLTATSGTFDGDLLAESGIFNGDLRANDLTANDLTARIGAFSGDLTAVSGTFSGDLTARIGTFSGTVTTGNTLQVGENTNDATSKTIQFGGTIGDYGYDYCVIENRVYGSTEKRELLLFSGNDYSTGSGPDRIRLKGAEILFDTYNVDINNDRETETTKMIVKGDGKVGIGITTPLAQLHVTGDTYIVGELHVSQDIIGFSTTAVSDRRLKYNIQELNDENIIEKLKPVSFYWNDNIMNETLRNKQDIGLIAQDVEEHIPIAVKEKQMMDGKKYKTINYNNIIPYLITSLQKAHSKINELEERLNNLM